MVIKKPTTSSFMTDFHHIELFAGLRPDGQPVAERLQVQTTDDGALVLLRSPAFVKGVARGDKIKLDSKDQSFELIKRSGNLAIQVFCREEVGPLAEDLGPRIEKLGGTLDLENERMLVFSIHVSCGFANIEAILNDHIGEETESVWYYGNVYDPKDGVTPLNWWQDILKPQ